MNADQKKVLSALIGAFRSNKGILDMMDVVNAELLGMTEKQFSKAMFMLQEDGKINGVMFEDGNPEKITMWDGVNVQLQNFETKEV